MCCNLFLIVEPSSQTTHIPLHVLTDLFSYFSQLSIYFWNNKSYVLCKRTHTHNQNVWFRNLKQHFKEGFVSTLNLKIAQVKSCFVTYVEPN